MMKLQSKLLLFVLVVVSLCSCKKSDENLKPLGYYSYKLSGIIEIEQIAPPVPVEGFVAKKHTFAMVPESGQLSILQEPNGDKIVATMNALAGGATIGTASVNGRNIDISFPSKALKFDNHPTLPGENENENDEDEAQGLLQLAGKGERIDKMIVMQLQATGTIVYMNEYYTVKKSNFECVAKINQ